MVKVITRTNITEELDLSQIKKAIAFATQGLNVNPLELESKFHLELKEEITTSEIQESLIKQASAMTFDDPQWDLVASRLLLWNLYKKYHIATNRRPYENYCNDILDLYNDGKLSNLLVDNYSRLELKEAGAWINQDYDLSLPHSGTLLLSERSLLSEKELPQTAFLSCALLLALNETDKMVFAKNLYHAIASRKISLATPIINSLRSKIHTSLTSCFISMLDDNIESIFDEVKNTALISKNGGGVGLNLSKIRATGSDLMGVDNASKGITPWCKILNDTVVGVNQGGKRAGAATIALDIWHSDIISFLDMSNEHGDQRLKAYDLFTQVVIPDLFMKRLPNNDIWTLFCPHEVKQHYNIDLPSLFGQEFDDVYLFLENEIKEDPFGASNPNKDKLKCTKRIPSKELFAVIMKNALQRGIPYLFFKDTVNRANPNKHEGYIPNGNLCVAPETKILTDKGHFAIADLVEQQVNVWNGSEWSEVRVKQTGINQPLLKVNFSNGESLECTYYHRFWVQDTYRSKPRRVEAKDLQPDDKLIKYKLPLIESNDDVDFPYAYTSGCFSGDGSYSGKGHPEIDLYDEKKQLVTHLAIRNKLHCSKNHTKELDAIAIYNDYKQDRLVCKLPLDILPKYTVPLNGYTIKSRLEWLAGLLDTDGTVSRNGTNESLSIASIHKTFLLDVRLMLQTLGVDSKVTPLKEEGNYLLPDGKGSKKEYLCKQSYRLLINSNGLFQLSELGLKTYRLKWEKRQPQREASQFIKVVEVELTCRKDDTYCFTEPKKHLGMFNGILTGQCMESFSNVEAGKYIHCCNLVSLNLANIENDEIPFLANLAVRLLDNTIDLTIPPVEEAKAHNDRYRTIGVGVMGLADWLAKRNLKYQNLTEISEVIETISYHCVKTSMELAKERGAYPAFQGSDWSQGIFNGCTASELTAMGNLNWNSLLDEVKSFGIRNSHLMAIAPNTSSSLIQGCTASVLPLFNKNFIYKSGFRTIPIVPPFDSDNYQLNIKLRQEVVVEAIATIQKWIDTGISMELIFNGNEDAYEDGQTLQFPKDIFKVYYLAWLKGCKTVYYTRSVQTASKPKPQCDCAN